MKDDMIVLIESDWNLKSKRYRGTDGTKRVLIESDWNLKFYHKIKAMQKPSINRIRLEFKGLSAILFRRKW